MEEIIEDAYWDSEKEIYVFENLFNGGNLYLPDIEKSLREQGFEDVSNDYGSYDTVLRKSNQIQSRIYDDKLELDFYGTRLSGLKEDPELFHSLHHGHRNPKFWGDLGADSLEVLLEAEENPSKSYMYP